MVRLQGLHRRFRLRPPLGTGIVVVAFDKLKHRMPTNLLLVRTSCPAESMAGQQRTLICRKFVRLPLVP